MGVALATVAAVKGYRGVFTIPDKMSIKKIRRLRAFGAEVVVAPAAEAENLRYQG
jgi:cystathionine beta-synthase